MPSQTSQSSQTSLTRHTQFLMNEDLIFVPLVLTGDDDHGDQPDGTQVVNIRVEGSASADVGEFHQLRPGDAYFSHWHDGTTREAVERVVELLGLTLKEPCG